MFVLSVLGKVQMNEIKRGAWVLKHFKIFREVWYFVRNGQPVY